MEFDALGLGVDVSGGELDLERRAMIDVVARTEMFLAALGTTCQL